MEQTGNKSTKILCSRIKKIQGGETRLEEELIEENMSFIINAISGTTHRYVDTRNSEELSIGLEAFHEAVQKFDPSKGSFHSFARSLIHNRIVDFWRREKKHDVRISEEWNDRQFGHDEDFAGKIQLKEEINNYSDFLKDFGIDFLQLADEAPRHRKTREKILSVALEINKRQDWVSWIKENRRLPRKMIREEYGLSDRVITAHRKYLIACIILLSSQWDMLKEYIITAEGSK